MRTWTAILVLAAGTYALKATGPVVLAGRRLPPVVVQLAALLPAALLAALVAIGTAGSGQALEADARLAGLAAAAVALWRKQGFLVVVLVAMAATAAARAIS